MTGKHRGGWDFTAAAESPAGASRAPGGRGEHSAVGDRRVGDRRVGDRRVGDRRTGHWWVSDRQAGDRRVGDRRIGHRRVSDRIDDGLRTLARGTGELMVTCGAVLLLFVVYEVWVSNLFADHKQAQVHQRLATAWQRGQDPLKGQDRLNLPVGKQVVLPAGQGFANLYIPAFGKDYARTIVQGTSDSNLDAGPGHYVTSQLPGQLGNFAVAGHRVGKGEPFLNLDKLHPGDLIVVQTARNWYVYEVLGSRSAYQAASRIPDRTRRDAAVAAALSVPDSQGVRGREIVSPSAVAVIDPVPDHPQATATRALLTLTTCHPKYSASQRLIVHAQLVRAVPRAGDTLPRELPGGTS
jgi:sortase A